MKIKNILSQGLALLALSAAMTPPAEGLTLIRAGLDTMVTRNTSIVVGTVVDAESYWNDGGSFILTDVRVQTTQVLKGSIAHEFSFTMMGGSAGEYTTVIPGGADLVLGNSYILFLRQEALPGKKATTTVAEHTQGVFDVVTLKDGRQWATSQAADMALVDDEEDGEDADVPGGAKGMELAELTGQILELVRLNDGGKR